jgi:hypothetical protein
LTILAQNLAENISRFHYSTLILVFIEKAMPKFLADAFNSPVIMLERESEEKIGKREKQRKIKVSKISECWR